MTSYWCCHNLLFVTLTEGSVFIKGQIYYNKELDEHVLCFGFRAWAAQGYVVEHQTDLSGEARSLKTVLLMIKGSSS